MFLLEILLELLGELLFQIVGELVLDGVFQLGDVATRGRMRRILWFAGGGFVAGLGSALVRRGLVLDDPVVRYAAVAGSAVVAGLVLALFEARVLRRGRGAALAGFLSGAGFSLAYALGRHAMRA